MPETFVHATAVIDPGAIVGSGTAIWHFCHVMSEAQIGKDCILGQNVFVARGVSIGNGCKIQNNVSLYEGVTLEDQVFCGPSVVFTNVMTPRSHIDRRKELKETRICYGASIGANATILCGIVIGPFAMVGAGSVVTRSVPPYSLCVGNPAKAIGWVCECGERLVMEADLSVCPRCGSKYRQESDF